jgi:2-dehydropantoate 2-reductase
MTSRGAPAARPAVAVVGAGAIGSFFAAYLIEAGQSDVTLCARRPFDWLVVESERWGETVRSSPRVVTDPSRAVLELGGRVEWVLLATKAHQTQGAADWLRALVGPTTIVVVLQNGVEHLDRVRPLVPAGTRVMPAVVYAGAEMVAPGHAVHRTNGFFHVPARDDAQGITLRDGERLDALFASERNFVRPTEDFVTVAWEKLCANVAANGVTALTMRRMDVVRRPDVSEVLGMLLAECIAVGRAEGAHLPDVFGDRVREHQAAFPDAAGTSMLYDRLAGRPMEEDAIYGAVVRAGRRHGIGTPVTGTVLALLAAISEGSATAAISEGSATAAISEGSATAAISEGSATAAISEGSATAAISEGSATAGRAL